MRKIAACGLSEDNFFAPNWLEEFKSIAERIKCVEAGEAGEVVVPSHLDAIAMKVGGKFVQPGDQETGVGLLKPAPATNDERWRLLHLGHTEDVSPKFATRILGTGWNRH